LDPYSDQGRLLICVSTKNKEGFGVFSGSNFSFNQDDRNKRQKVICHKEWGGNGLEVFEIEIKNLPQPELFQILEYHFSIISYKHSGYLNYPESNELIITLQRDCCYFSYKNLEINMAL